MWTEEMRAKAAATRQRKKEERHAANGNGDTQTGDGLLPKEPTPDAVVHSQRVSKIGQPNHGNGSESHALPNRHAQQPSAEVFDWEEAPITEALNKLAEMKREYERVSVIIARRQNPANNYKWKCYTAEHPELVPASLKYQGESVRAKCLKGGDGVTRMPKFTDNGRFEIVDGIRVRRPAH